MLIPLPECVPPPAGLRRSFVRQSQRATRRSPPLTVFQPITLALRAHFRLHLHGPDLPGILNHGCLLILLRLCTAALPHASPKAGCTVQILWTASNLCGRVQEKPTRCSQPHLAAHHEAAQRMISARLSLKLRFLQKFPGSPGFRPSDYRHPVRTRVRRAFSLLTTVNSRENGCQQDSVAAAFHSHASIGDRQGVLLEEKMNRS
jgi:hypothetical protein